MVPGKKSYAFNSVVTVSRFCTHFQTSPGTEDANVPLL